MIFFIALVCCIGARLAGGAGQGSLFGAVFVVTLLAPKLKEIPAVILAILLSNLGAGLPFATLTESLLVITTYAIALAGLRKWIGYSLALIAGFAWLFCPIWLGQHVTPAIVKVHPLFAINKLTISQGIWPERPVMYQWSALGQDVAYSLPSSIWSCVIAQLFVSMLNLIPKFTARARGASPAAK